MMKIDFNEIKMTQINTELYFKTGNLELNAKGVIYVCNLFQGKLWIGYVSSACVRYVNFIFLFDLIIIYLATERNTYRDFRYSAFFSAPT